MRVCVATRPLSVYRKRILPISACTMPSTKQMFELNWRATRATRTPAIHSSFQVVRSFRLYRCACVCVCFLINGTSYIFFCPVSNVKICGTMFRIAYNSTRAHKIHGSRDKKRLYKSSVWNLISEQTAQWHETSASGAAENCNLIAPNCGLSKIQLF